MRGKVSIIALAHEEHRDHAASTRQCLAAARTFTDVPHEVILIASGSCSAEDTSQAGAIRRVSASQDVSIAEAWNLGASPHYSQTGRTYKRPSAKR